MSLEKTRAEVETFRPEMVVIQAATPSIYSDLGYARICKEILDDGCLTVMVGAHVSAEPEDTLQRSDGFLDMVARGEYQGMFRTPLLS